MWLIISAITIIEAMSLPLKLPSQCRNWPCRRLNATRAHNISILSLISLTATGRFRFSGYIGAILNWRYTLLKNVTNVAVIHTENASVEEHKTLYENLRTHFLFPLMQTISLRYKNMIGHDVFLL